MSIKRNRHYSPLTEKWIICESEKCKYRKHATHSELIDARRHIRFTKNPKESIITVDHKLVTKIRNQKAANTYIFPEKKPAVLWYMSEEQQALTAKRRDLTVDENQYPESFNPEISFIENFHQLEGKSLIPNYQKTNVNPGNKGWRGACVENLLRIKKNSRSSPDHFSGEVKSFLFAKSGEMVPKESIAIVTFNPDSYNNPVMYDVINKTPFVDTHIFYKIKSLLLAGISDFDDGNTLVMYTSHVDFGDFNLYHKEIKDMEESWNALVNHYATHNNMKFRGTGVFECRPKGSKNSTTRAIYLQPPFMGGLLETEFNSRP